MQQQIHFTQINAEQLGELITANMKKAIVPHFHQLHCITPKQWRYTQQLHVALLRAVITAFGSGTMNRKVLKELAEYQAVQMRDELQKVKIGMEG